MPQSVLVRPAAFDHAAYYQRYIDLVPAGNLVEIMTDQVDQLRSLLLPLSESEAGFAYAPDKWTIREMLGHLTDAERVFAYRATAFARADPSPLPGFDQDAWLPIGEFESRSLPDLIEEWVAARGSSVALLRGLPDAALKRSGVASDNHVSVLSLLTILPGHVEYHFRRLKADYFPAMPGRSA